MFLNKYRAQFEERLPTALIRMGEKNRLRDACEYALLSGGKRVRPLIVLMTADALSNGMDVFPAALGVEFFHTASLIADDLPCMDNDDWRRGRPSLHKEFGENIAILASYVLIAEGYGSIHASAEAMRLDPRFVGSADQRGLFCLQAASACGGIRGAANGQFLDLYPPDSGLKTLEKVVAQKTSTLFEIAFLFGWIFGGGPLSEAPRLRECASHLGMMFQIADDLADDTQDARRCCEANVARVLGEKEAIALLEKEKDSFQKILKGLGLWTAPFQELFTFLT